MIDPLLLTAAVALYFGLIMAIAHYGRLKTGPGVEEYYLAGRRVTGVVAALTYAATTYSVFMMVGLVGLTYAYGVGALGFELTYLLATVLLLSIFAPRFWAAGRRRGYITPTQLLADRYESRSVGIAATFICLVFLIPYMSIQGMGSAYLLEELSGGVIPYEAGLTMIVAVMTLCALWGGFRGVAWTDAVQGLVMLTTSLYLLLYIAFTHLGGWGGFVSIVESKHPELLSVPGPGFFSFPRFLELTVPWFFFALTNPQVSQRLFVSRSTASLRAMIAGFFVFGFLYTMTTVTLGLMARALGVEASPPDRAMPIILRTMVPPALALIVMLGIISAGVTTVNSIMLSLGSMVGRDVYASLRRSPSERVEARIGYVVIAAEALLVWLFALHRPGLISLLAVMASGGLLVQLPAIVGAFFWRRGTAAGALTSMIAGGVITGLLYYYRLSPLEHGPPVWGLLITAAIFVAVSLVTKRPAAADAFIEEVNRELRMRVYGEGLSKAS
ncbi:MAG: sodium:solute symporter family protein [Candidatus Nezhaarchaeota archaeon]|nr:sodium:solute symporter family protein [Candidatus Nezhaarchaeota archaeon]